MRATTRQRLSEMVRRLGLRHALRTAAAAVATEVVVTALALPQGYWAVITAVIVMQANLGGSIWASWTRLAGTAVGATIGALAAHFLGQTTLSVGLAVFVTLAICTAIRRLRESTRVGGITTVIVILAGHPGVSAATLGFDRFLEISVGIVTALAVSILVLPSRASKALDYGLATIFEDLAAFFALVVEGRLHEDYVARKAFSLKDRILRTLARCRQLRHDAVMEGRGGGSEGTMRAMLLFRCERLFEHILAMDHVASESQGQGLHRHLPQELTDLERAVATVLTGLAGHMRGKAPLPDLTELNTAVARAREKLATMRRDRAPAAYDLSEVMHFYSFMHGMLSCAADAAELARRTHSFGDA